jgi:hypothetical protein
MKSGSNETLSMDELKDQVCHYLFMIMYLFNLSFDILLYL